VTVRTGLRSRWRWLLIPLLAVPIGWLLFTGLGRDPRSIPSPLIGQPLPSLVGPTLDSGQFDDTALGGRPAVINVWASYCVPCRAEHGLLRDLVEQHGDDVSVIGVIYETNEDAARDFQERYGSGWTELTDPGGRTALDLGVTGPPETFFVDADGIVRYRHLGPLTTDVLRQQLAALGVEL
jgi:cytochrome c biogenesis protein CcmG, thiol:disulfide interchange protein DsbE